MKIEDLTPDPHNANRGTERGHAIIERSVRQRGAGRSGLAASDGTMIAGSQTLQKMAELGIPIRPVHTNGEEWVVVIRDDIEPGSEAATLLALEDNRATEVGLSWEPDVLASLADMDLSSLFTAQEFAELAQPAMPEAGGDEFDTTPEEGETRTHLGELWAIGPHRLFVGDCTKAENVSRLMGNKKARFEFTDPPYEIETVGGGLLKESAAMRAIEQAGIDTFDPSNLTLESPTAVFCCNKPLIPVYLQLATNRKVAWDICFYLKENVTPNYGGHMMTDVEYLMLLGAQGPISGQEKELYSKAYIGGLDLNNDVAWQKPVALVEKFIRLYSEVGTAVLDRFGGTGTTLVAAHRQGRVAYLAELLPKYADVILRRAEAEGLECILLD